MSRRDIVEVVVGALVLFAIYFIAVPALISAKSTVAVVCGVLIVVIGGAFALNYIYEIFFKKEKTDV
jgi:protein-S-isoprenylcysteine O-methyltransferase Ste14